MDNKKDAKPEVEKAEPKGAQAKADGKKLKDPQLKEVVGGLSTPARDQGVQLTAIGVVKPPIAHK